MDVGLRACEVLPRAASKLDVDPSAGLGRLLNRGGGSSRADLTALLLPDMRALRHGIASQ